MPSPPRPPAPSSRANAKPAVLLTGFGPFPGVAENASAHLVRALARQARATFPSHAFHTRILATEWARVSARVAHLYATLQPVVALHFGVATGSAVIRLETCAHNACRPAPDAAGHMPLAPRLTASGPLRQSATIPVAALVNQLRTSGLPVEPSNDAGGYLCNAVLYHALSHTEASGRPVQVGFIHVPDNLKAPPVTLSVAVRAGLEIIDACLASRDPRTG